MNLSMDRLQVREIIVEARSEGRLRYPHWRSLLEIVKRNQNNGVFTEAEWTTLRDWCDAHQAAQRANAAVEKAFGF